MLRDHTKSVTLIVVSDILSQLNLMVLHFSQIFSNKKVNIKSLLLNTQKPDILNEFPNSIIVVDQKFKNTIRDLYLSADNHSSIIVPVSTELHALDTESVYHAMNIQEDTMYLEMITLQP